MSSSIRYTRQEQAARDNRDVRMEILQLATDLLAHELQEWLMIDGTRVKEPHDHEP